jgi:hypothetical protein
MNADRRAILNLVAMGRITPREAERLLAVSNDWDEVTLRLAVCGAVLWVAVPQIHRVFAGLERMAGALLPDVLAAAHHGLAMISGLVGGIL